MQVPHEVLAPATSSRAPRSPGGHERTDVAVLVERTLLGTQNRTDLSLAMVGRNANANANADRGGTGAGCWWRVGVTCAPHE